MICIGHLNIFFSDKTFMRAQHVLSYHQLSTMTTTYLFFVQVRVDLVGDDAGVGRHGSLRHLPRVHHSQITIFICLKLRLFRQLLHEKMPNDKNKTYQSIVLSTLLAYHVNIEQSLHFVHFVCIAVSVFSLFLSTFDIDENVVFFNE